MKHQPQRKFVHISFSQMPTDVGGFWETMCECLKEQEALPKLFRLSQIAGHAASQQSEEDLRVSPAEVAQIIAKRRLTAFSVNTGYEIRSVGYRLHQFSFHCGIDNNDKALNSWRIFIERIASCFPPIGSWIPFSPYQSWQNLQSSDDYKSGNYGQYHPASGRRMSRINMGLVPDKWCSRMS